MLTRAAIGLGSNLGDRVAHLEAAIESLSLLGNVACLSSWYETAPIGDSAQEPYLNAVAIIETELSPLNLMGALHEIERHQGRERRERWDSRTIDLDILLYGRLSISDDELVVPHPELTARRFALEPLVEAWPDAALPDGTFIETFLPNVQDQSVERIETLQRTQDLYKDLSRWAPFIVFLIVGLGSVLVWWGFGIFLH